MKTILYEAIKAYSNKLLPTLILLSFLGNGIVFYNSNILSGTDSFIAKENSIYYKIIEDYKNKPVNQAFNELKTLNEELQAFINIQALSQNVIGQSQETIDDQLNLIEEQYPGILTKYYGNDYKLYSGSIETDASLVNEIFNQINYIHGYRDYLESITSRMNEMLSVSVFYKKDTFAYRNIIQTPLDFEPLKDISLELDVSAGVIHATNNNLTDIFVIGIVLLLCIYLISIEKDRKILPLIRSTRRGRGITIASKIFILAISAGLLSLLFYSSDILIARQAFGLGDLNRNIQSIPEFKGCTIPLTVWQYLLVFLLTKTLTVTLISLTIFTVVLISSNSSLAYTIIATIFTAEWLAWKLIPVVSWVNHIKFINLFSFMDVFGLYSNYQNLNIFGQPLSIRFIFFIVVPVCVTVLTIICFTAFSRLGAIQKVGIIEYIQDAMRRVWGRLPNTIGLFSHEMYRLLISQKALLVLLLLLVIQFYSISGYFVVRNSDQILYQHYLSQVDGEVTESTGRYIFDEQANFDNAIMVVEKAAADLKDSKISQDDYNSIMARNTMLLERKNAFNWITAQYEYIDNLRKTGINARFVDPMGYTQLFALNSYEGDLVNLLLLTAVLIACLAAVFAYDNVVRTKTVVLACKDGRGKDIFQRYLVCSIISLITAALVYGTQFYNIYIWYELKDWDAPIQSVMAFKDSSIMSVPQFTNLSLRMTIGQYILLIYGIRLISVGLLASIVIFISSISGSIFLSIFTSTIVLELPVLFYLLGFDGAKYLSVIEPISANMLVAETYSSFLLVGIPLFLSVLTVFLLLISKKLYIRSRFT